MIIKNKLNTNDIKLLIYDVDGTLVEFRTLYSLIKESFNIFDIPFVKANFNEYLYSVSQALKSDENDFDFDKLAGSFEANFKILKKYGINGKDYLNLLLNLEYNYTYLCSGVKNALPLLYKKYQQVISTNWFRASQEMKLNKFRLLKYFERMYTCEKVYPKPNKKHFEMILNDYKLNPEECIVIGDSISDMRSHNYGFNTILMDYRKTKQQLYDYSTVIIDDFREIPKILTRK